MRNQFVSTGIIPVSDLQLDQENPRFGRLENQADCIEVMFEEYGDNIVNIASNISKKGLGPDPIVVLKEGTNWVVKEGNRRSVALKVLNNPNEAPDNRKATFYSLKQNAEPRAIPVGIECLTGPPDVVADYVALRHLGAQNGVGLMFWDPRGQENYRATKGQKLTYPQAMHLTRFLEKNGVPEVKKVYLSNLQRLIQSRPVIDALGLLWDDVDPLFQDEKQALSILKEIVLDFSERGKRVKDIYTVEKIEKYIDEVLARPVIPVLPKVEDTGNQKMGNEPRARGRQPKAAWDRPCIFPKRKVYFSVPHTETKLNNILKELACLSVRDAPISVGVLLRALIEISVIHYVNKNKLICGADSDLKNKIKHSSIHMNSQSVIDKDYKNSIVSMGNSEDLLSVASLHAWVHSARITPSAQNLCIFWDNIAPFVAACWE